MNEEILRRLSVITEEEQRILDGDPEIDRSLYMEGGVDRITQKKLLEKGRMIAIRPHTRFIHFPPHTHDYVEIVCMVQGRTRHLVNGHPFDLDAGEILMIGQHAVHEIERAGREDLAVNFIVKPDFFGGIMSYLGHEETPLRRFVLDSLRGGGETEWLCFRVSRELPVQNLLENLLWTMISGSPHKRGILQMTMGLLFAELLERTEAMRFPTREQETLVRVLRDLEENYRESSLTALAEALHYDQAALSRLIRRKTGKTYKQLLQEKRLSQAAWMLEHTDRNVDEIARLVGYENISFFHRLFLVRFGMHPRQYRISAQEREEAGR